MNITIVILTRNEEAFISGCLRSLGELKKHALVIDDNSADSTVSICRNEGVEVIVHEREDFAAQRTFALTKVSTDWIFYLDADERLTPSLRNELVKISGESGEITAYLVKRRNFYLGKEWKVMDRVHRLFLRSKLNGWTGKVHESPVFEGKSGELVNPLIHFTHRDVLSMLRKTLEWSEVEARLRLDAGHPAVSWWRLPRVCFTEFWRVGIVERGVFNGTEGWIETLYQCFSIFMTYARLWELQRKEPLRETYKRLDDSL